MSSSHVRLLVVFSLLFLHQATQAQTEQPTHRSADVFDLSKPTAWQTLTGDPVAENWKFRDGEIRLVAPQGARGSIVTAPLPLNFELSFEWKIEGGTNTGLKYRVRKFGKSVFNNRFLGLEYQIIDDHSGDESKNSTAAIYDLVPARNKVLHAVGQWNQAKIVARGKDIEHYLNGHLVASARTSGVTWQKRLAFSKFYAAKNFGEARVGDRIMLTDHGGKASYRNLLFTRKDAPESSETVESNAPFLANGMRNSWADQESIVIWTRTTAREAMLTNGRQFLSLSAKEAGQLAKLSDEQALMAAQLPEGVSLSDMFGACPGFPGEVRLTYFPEKRKQEARLTSWKETKPDTDFTAQWSLRDLRPDTKYAVVVETRSLESQATTAILRGAFQTAPAADKLEELKFCMTTCHDFIRRDNGMRGHKIYDAMSRIAPDFVVHAGDIEYYDKPAPWALTEDLMRFKWGRIFSLPANRNFYSSTTSYFLKDDHDTLKNDCWAGQTYGAVSFERGVEIFNKEQFPSLNPRYTTTLWGKDLQLWFLEGRDYRSPNNMPDGPEKTILGDVQKRWLFETLAASKARFKIIFSPTPVVGPDRRNKRDNHANDVFAHEGEEIRNFLSDIQNVIVLCGDRHWQYASHDQEGDLWEFGCGPGSEKHQFGWKPGDERPMHKFLRVKGGFLSGELSYTGKANTPSLVLRHHSVDGKAVSEFTFPTKE